MRLDIISADIQYRHSQGESYKRIGESLGISAPTADRIAHGKRPGKKVCEILGLDPSPDLAYTRKRNQRLDSIARLWGHTNWSAYETAVLSDYYKEK